jgi:SAM-dependent methyltransferase
MWPVCCAGQQLPFRDRSFDAVVVSDVVEHVAPGLRKRVVNEALRVARQLVVIGYPCGPSAFDLDRKLFREYQTRNLATPSWLQEHMLHPFPDETLLDELPPGWKREIIPNESLGFRAWMMKAEMFRLSDHLFRLALRLGPRIMERLLRHANAEPSYRKVFILSRKAREEYA